MNTKSFPNESLINIITAITKVCSACKVTDECVSEAQLVGLV